MQRDQLMDIYYNITDGVEQINQIFEDTLPDWEGSDDDIELVPEQKWKAIEALQRIRNAVVDYTI